MLILLVWTYTLRHRQCPTAECLSTLKFAYFMLTRISNCNARLIASSSRTAAAVAAASTLAAASPALAQRLVERRLNVISSSLSLNHSWSLPQQEFIKWKDTLQVSSIEEAILRSLTEIRIETQSQSQFLFQSLSRSISTSICFLFVCLAFLALQFCLVH